MREFLKSAGRALALLVMVPALVSYAVRRSVLGADRALEGSSQALALVPGIPGQYLRRAFLAMTTDGCAPSATICFGTLFSKSGVRIDPEVYVGPGCSI